MDIPTTVDARFVAAHVRRVVVDQSKRANVGHIGSALSVADIMAALVTAGVVGGQHDGDPDRDRFVLSKGHAALALFACLHATGRIDDERLDTYCAEDTLLGVHPERDLVGVDFCTGSLGQGMTFAVGAALAARMQKSTRRVFALLSDAECNEGSVWEAVMFAAHHRLGNLTAIVDANGQQALGYTQDVLSLSDLAGRWRVFGWDVEEADGHDPDRLSTLLTRPAQPDAAPRVIVAQTVFGRGVSYMEGRIPWHYLPMSEGEYAIAVDDLAKLT